MDGPCITSTLQKASRHILANNALETSEKG